MSRSRLIFRFIIVVVGCVLAFSDATFAQDVIQKRLNLGMNLYRNGKKSESLKIFEEVYSSNHYNRNVVVAYSQVLEGMKKDSLLENILSTYLTKQEDLQLRCKYAEVLIRLNREDEAKKSWQIAKKNKDEDTFLQVANSQAWGLRYDLSIKTINEAREYLDDSDLFTNEMGDYCIFAKDYKKLTDEILFQFKAEPIGYNIQRFVQTALMRIPEFKDYFKTAIYQCAMYKSDDKVDRMCMLAFMGWFYYVIDEFDQALESYKKFDKINGSKENCRVLTYAETLLNDGYYEHALKAFNYMISSANLPNEILLRALYGNNMTLEKVAESGQDFSREEYEKVVQGYRNISKQYSFDKNVVQQSVFREGCIQFEKLGNTSEAIKCFEQFISFGHKSALLFNSLNKLGDIYVFMDSLDKAKSYYSKVITDGKRFRSADDALDYARYELAEIEYFKGNISTAYDMFKEISEDYSKNSSNDATSMILFLEESKEQNKAVQEFALAEKLTKQQKIDTAVQTFREAIQYGNNDLKKVALLKIANIYKSAKNHEMQNQVLQEFQTAFPDADELDVVMYDSGRCLFEMKQGQQAIEVLTSMLVQYPRSIYAEKARELIAIIRKTFNA